ncbi:MAG: DUF3275 family protein [Candidatus Paceibacterota bacterium]|jgi:hypothetical protein
MVKLPGVLHIKLISGRNGDFRVGRLVTEIGEFAVKDAELDQFEEGRYEGVFGISQIYPASYPANGRFVVEVRARLNQIALATEDAPEPVDNTGLESDPLDEPAPAFLAAPKTEIIPHPVHVERDDANTTPAASTDAEAEAEAEADVELFGLLWPLANPLKLDPTVDRNMFRRQRDRLKALGYTFQAIGQQWLKS